jgi:hypothetical protein
MLNPECRMLDPEKEQLERLASLSEENRPENVWRDTLLSLDTSVLENIVNNAIVSLSTPGVHLGSEVDQSLRQAAQTDGIPTLEPKYFGWPESLWQKVLDKYSDSRVLMLGILDGEGIWAGGLLGVHGHGVDFVTTFRLLWNDDPELASKQTFQDLPELCQIIQKRFGRPVTGLFIYRNEFTSWRDQGWSSEAFQSFLKDNTATLCG